MYTTAIVPRRGTLTAKRAPEVLAGLEWVVSVARTHWVCSGGCTRGSGQAGIARAQPMHIQLSLVPNTA